MRGEYELIPIDEDGMSPIEIILTEHINELYSEINLLRRNTLLYSFCQKLRDLSYTSIICIGYIGAALIFYSLLKLAAWMIR